MLKEAIEAWKLIHLYYFTKHHHLEATFYSLHFQKLSNPINPRHAIKLVRLDFVVRLLDNFDSISSIKDMLSVLIFIWKLQIFCKILRNGCQLKLSILKVNTNFHDMKILLIKKAFLGL
jgi:hypothetical protein